MHPIRFRESRLNVNLCQDHMGDFKFQGSVVYHDAAENEDTLINGLDPSPTRVEDEVACYACNPKAAKSAEKKAA